MAILNNLVLRTFLLTENFNENTPFPVSLI